MGATRECLNCFGTGRRSWPQSRSTNPRNPREREQLAPQVTSCGACAGSGRIRLTGAQRPEPGDFGPELDQIVDESGHIPWSQGRI